MFALLLASASCGSSSWLDGEWKTGCLSSGSYLVTRGLEVSYDKSQDYELIEVVFDPKEGTCTTPVFSTRVVGSYHYGERLGTSDLERKIDLKESAAFVTLQNDVLVAFANIDSGACGKVDWRRDIEREVTDLTCKDVDFRKGRTSYQIFRVQEVGAVRELRFGLLEAGRDAISESARPISFDPTFAYRFLEDEPALSASPIATITPFPSPTPSPTPIVVEFEVANLKIAVGTDLTTGTTNLAIVTGRITRTSADKPGELPTITTRFYSDSYSTKITDVRSLYSEEFPSVGSFIDFSADYSKVVLKPASGGYDRVCADVKVSRSWLYDWTHVGCVTGQ